MLKSPYFLLIILCTQVNPDPHAVRRVFGAEPGFFWQTVDVTGALPQHVVQPQADVENSFCLFAPKVKILAIYGEKMRPSTVTLWFHHCQNQTVALFFKFFESEAEKFVLVFLIIKS